jgi:hypothetical protein
MKTTKLICLAVLICMVVPFANAQWDNVVRMTNADGYSLTSFSNQNNIAVNGNVVHMVYYDQRDAELPFIPTTGYDVYYTRSDDNGTSYGAEIKLASGLNPSIAVNGSVVHVVYDASRNGEREVYYRRSDDNGDTWSTEVNITSGVSMQTMASLAVSGNNVHVAYYDDSMGNFEIFHIRSTNGGSSWLAKTRISNTAGKSWFPCLGTSGSNVHIVWVDFASNNSIVLYSKSLNNGQSFSNPVQINAKANKNTTGIDINFPTLAVSGKYLTVVFSQVSAGLLRLRYITSSNDGGKWSGEFQFVATSNTSGYYMPSLSASGSSFHLAYSLSCGYIYYRKSTNNGSAWGSITSITPNGFHCRPSIAASGSNVHMIYYNNAHYFSPPDSLTNIEIWYRRNVNGGNGTAGMIAPGTVTMECETPVTTELSQNFPNPFNPTTKISFSIANEGFVSLKVYDMVGREVMTLVSGNKTTGSHEVEFNATHLTSGVYFYKLETPGYSDMKRMMLIK